MNSPNTPGSDPAEKPEGAVTPHATAVPRSEDETATVAEIAEDSAGASAAPAQASGDVEDEPLKPDPGHTIPHGGTRRVLAML
ncbi:MAG TPA: hypothetical protein VFP88_07295, partial [Rhodanobacteraceae bacterium]|nr:hypothetical protein [Rhodanobacteraceae bacterium]